MQELTDAQAHKAHFLWRFADEAGIGCSRDEVADMVLMDRVCALGVGWEAAVPVRHRLADARL